MNSESVNNHCAVIGNPIGHSLSPQIHQVFASQFSMPLSYDRIQATEEDFDAIVGQFFKSGGTGLNITTPFKERAFALCDQTCSMSKAAQSCNTLYMSAGKLVP